MNVGRVLVRGATRDVAVGGAGRELFVKNTGLHTKEQQTKIGEEVRTVASADVRTHGYIGEVWNPEQMPWGGWSIGDKMGGEVVTGFTATMGEGGCTVMPVLQDPDVLRAGALDRKLTRLSQGGRSQWSSPASPPKRDTEGKDSGIPEWSSSGRVRHNAYSVLSRMKRGFNFAWLELSVRVASDEHHGRDVYVSAFVLSRDAKTQTGLINIGLPHGKPRSIVKVNHLVPAGSSLIYASFLGGGNEDASPAWTYIPVDLTVTAHGVVV